MKATRTIVSLAALAAFAGVAAAQDSVVLVPGLMIRPFAGLAAGRPPLSSPKFGVIDMPGGPLGGLMYISELGGFEVSKILPNGQELPFTSIGGPLPFACFGVDIDGPTANLRAPTRGLFGGPVMLNITQGNAGGAGGAFPIMRSPFPGGWAPWFPIPATPGPAQLQFDRTPGFMYGGMMYYSDWGADGSDAIIRVNPAGGAALFANLAGRDPRYFTFDISGGAAGYGPNALWVSSFNTGQLFSVSPAGVPAPPLAVLNIGIEGIAFGPGDPLFGPWLYSANLNQGTVDIVLPGGAVVPFVAGMPGAAYLMFVTQGPYAKYNSPTLYIADGNDSVWVVFHCPADFNYDGFIDFFDLDAYTACFEGTFCPAGHTADFNGDGFVDFFDYDAFVLAFETGC